MKSNKSLFTVLTILVVIIAIGGAFAIGYMLPKKPQIIAVMNIEGTIRDIGELATAEYSYLIAQSADKPSKTLAGVEIPFTQSRVIYSYEGLIKAGINFTEVRIAVNEANKTIRIDLPNAKILSSELDHDSLVVFDEKNSPFNAFTFTDMNLSQASLKTSAEETAINKGLLDRAAENARRIISTTIMNFYDPNEYRIEFY